MIIPMFFSNLQWYYTPLETHNSIIINDSHALELKCGTIFQQTYLIWGIWYCFNVTLSPLSDIVLWIWGKYCQTNKKIWYVLNWCLDQCLLSCTINAYWALNEPLHSRVIIVCLPLDQRLSDAWSAHNHLLDQRLLSGTISTCQLLDKHL